jgi:glycerol-3-phosphate dehydrogenase
LPYQAGGSTGSITRRHIVYDHAPEFEGLLSIIGGKLTTFRALAEHAVDAVYKKLGQKSPPCSTRHVPLPGANSRDFTAYGRWFSQNANLPPETARRLLHIYGARSTAILDIIAQSPELSQPFSPETGALGAELVLAFEQEMAQTLSDALLRRTMAGLGPCLGLDAVESAAQLAQTHLGWDARRAEDEVAAYRRYIERFHPREMRR